MTGPRSGSEEVGRLETALLVVGSASLVAFASGYASVALLAVRQLLLHRFIWTGREFWWAAPVAEQGFVLALTVPFVLAALLRPSRWLVPLAGGVAGAVVSYAFVRLATDQRLHPVAMAVLAIGVGLQVGRTAAAHPARWRAAVRGAVPALAAFTLMLAAGMTAWASWTEQRRIAALPPAPAGAPNVLLLVLDTVRGESMSLYGYSRPTTPRIASFAARGVTFDHAFSTAPWTLASHASMFTGLQPWAIAGGFLSPLERGVPTVAESFARAGYLTAGFTANHVYTTYETGLSRGFQHFRGYRVSPKQIGLSSELGQMIADRSSTLLIRANHRTYSPTTNAQVLDWIGPGRDRPFFAFVNYMDAHLPYRIPPGWAARFGGGKTMVDRYDAALAHLDFQVGALLDSLERRGVLDNTIVVIASDHGEHLGDHGIDDHANSLYTQLLHVPLVIVAPGRAPAAVRIDTPVSLIDMAATLTGLAQVPDGAIPGESLARFWRGGAPDSSTLFAQVDRHPSGKGWFRNARGSLWAAISGRYHLIVNPDSTPELFDFTADPGETTDLAGDARYGNVVNALLAALEAPRAEDRVAERRTR